LVPILFIECGRTKRLLSMTCSSPSRWGGAWGSRPGKENVRSRKHGAETLKGTKKREKKRMRSAASETGAYQRRPNTQITAIYNRRGQAIFSSTTKTRRNRKTQAQRMMNKTVIEVSECETGGRQNILFQHSKKLLSSEGALLRTGVWDRPRKREER